MPDQGIKITRFGGLAPRFATELLPDGYAQEALNLRLTSGDLVPYRENEFLLDCDVADALSIYPVIVDDTFYWMMWATDVDVVRSPVTTLTTQRYYYTGDGVPKVTDDNRATFHTTTTKTGNYTQLSTDHEGTIEWTAAPFTYDLLAAATAGNQFAVVVKNSAGSGDITIDPNGAELVNGAATLVVAAGTSVLLKCTGTAWTGTVVDVYPYDKFTLGLPAPVTPPTIAFDTLAKAAGYTAVAGDSGKTLDATATPWTLALTAAATLGSSWILVVRNLGTGTLTVDPNGSELINGAATLAIASGEVGVITCNATAFTATVATGEFKGYVYTWVTEWGEESQPSDSSNLLLLTSGQRVQITGLPSAPPAGEYNVVEYNIYRTNTSDTGTAYQFVATQAISATTTYTDSVLDAALGDALASQFYEAPPTDLAGIVNMANGMTAAFHGNELCFSEPYKPHAWPPEYRFAVDYPIVAIGAIGNSLLVTTQGRPYIASGNHPRSVTVYPVDLPYPCLSKRGLVNMGTGIMYPSFEGLVFVPGTTPTLASIQLFTREEWKDYYPETIFARYYDGKYFGNYTTPEGETLSFIFQNAADRMALLVSTNIWASAGFSDPQTGEYYFVQNDKLYQWDSANSQNALMEWKSKDFALDKPTNFGVAKLYGTFTAPDYTAENAAIQAANTLITDDMGYMGGDEIADETEVAGDVFESLRSADTDVQVLFQLWTDKELRWQRYVSTATPFRLPTGYKADIVAVKVSARFRIHAILLAETPAALEALSAA